MKKLFCLGGGVLVSLSFSFASIAQEAPPFSSGSTFTEQTGHQLFRGVCQGCHMPDGKGAQGAGAYPVLAANSRLAGAEFVIFVVTNGKSGMPGFKDLLSDKQIATVVNYVRSNFGNDYGSDITVSDVKKMTQRP